MYAGIQKANGNLIIVVLNVLEKKSIILTYDSLTVIIVTTD